MSKDKAVLNDVSESDLFLFKSQLFLANPREMMKRDV